MIAERASYTVLEHTADMGIRVTGPTLGELFRNAALALMEIMLQERPAAEASPGRLTVKGEDLPDLMVRWLGEILYLLEGEGKVVMDLQVHEIVENRIDATVMTIPLDPLIHEIATEIKAVTYHQIEVGPCREGWQAVVIFDL